VQLFEKRHTTLLLAEIGSGGSVAAGLDSANGADRVLAGAYVAPSDERLRQLLQVPDSTWTHCESQAERMELVANAAAHGAPNRWVLVIGQPQTDARGSRAVDVILRKENGNFERQRLGLRGSDAAARFGLATQLLDHLRRQLR
jgi:nicotinamide mononucleotide (NMN) deamidase PncC